MGMVGRIGWSAASARQRLLDDQLARPLVEQRARLAIMAMRLEQAGQVALLRALTGRASADPRYRPVLRTLLDRTLAAEPAEPISSAPGRLVPTASGRVSCRA